MKDKDTQFLTEAYMQLNESSMAKTFDDIQEFTTQANHFPDWVRRDDRPLLRRPVYFGRQRPEFWVERESDGMWVPVMGKLNPNSWNSLPPQEEAQKIFNSYGMSGIRKTTPNEQ